MFVSPNFTILIVTASRIFRETWDDVVGAIPISWTCALKIFWDVERTASPAQNVRLVVAFTEAGSTLRCSND